VYDLRSSMQIGEILDMLSVTNINDINVIYCLLGPTGSRLAARFARIFYCNVCRCFNFITK